MATPDRAVGTDALGGALRSSNGHLDLNPPSLGAGGWEVPVVAHTPNPYTGKAEAEGPWASLAARLVETLSWGFSERPCQKTMESN